MDILKMSKMKKILKNKNLKKNPLFLVNYFVIINGNIL